MHRLQETQSACVVIFAEDPEREEMGQKPWFHMARIAWLV